MFIQDLYLWCENQDSFNRQDFAKYVYLHRESGQLAEKSGVDRRQFASRVSKEFIARMLTAGYLDMKHGVCICKGSPKRPYGFDLYTFDGVNNKYMREMMNVADMSDEELFGE